MELPISNYVMKPVEFGFHPFEQLNADLILLEETSEYKYFLLANEGKYFTFKFDGEKVFDSKSAKSVR